MLLHTRDIPTSPCRLVQSLPSSTSPEAGPIACVCGDMEQTSSPNSPIASININADGASTFSFAPLMAS